MLIERKGRSEENQKYYDAIIYNQIILFFVYVIPKEKSFIKRYRLLKEYSKLSKPYNLIDNKLFSKFLKNQNTISIFYYKLLFIFNLIGFSFLADLQIESYLFYKKYLARKILKENITMDTLIKCAKKQAKKSDTLNISAIIPNYNYENFMFERLYSILYQSEKINEIIILDDCSTDNSRELIDEIVLKLSPFINIRKVYNKSNSGSAFKQWKKGFLEAKGDYVWIAEADDYCESTFLENIVGPIPIINSYT